MMALLSIGAQRRGSAAASPEGRSPGGEDVGWNLLLGGSELRLTPTPNDIGIVATLSNALPFMDQFRATSSSHTDAPAKYNPNTPPKIT